MAGFFDNLRKMNELRQKAKKIQNSLSELEIPYENGGLRVVARGDMTIKSLEFLNPEILTPDNAAKLQRLFLDNTTCYRSKYGITWHNARTGQWRNYKFSIIEC